ncbi:hypothetical protein C380_18195 [Acidovorax sp. KKS102]|uniref:hypothetical protein n=1 Tax=Acidovorax sp. KKS102 TaxID=358220 RepID=UPI00028B3E9C|nr:hypothetical protein [Acidovorax sp. KKS102]AFU47333.1 hypothetical protein C380_18195 [Acidovorax sp. KKS102]
MSADLSCPVCGTELDLAVLFAHEGDQRALARLAAVSIPLGGRVLQYLALFTPPKQRLTAAKKIKLILQLLPDLEREAISWKGRDWPAPRTAWAMAIDQMLSARDAQRLELPMKGHGYLFAILAGMADRHEGQAEQQREQDLRTGPRAATVNGPKSVADLVQQPAPTAAPRPVPAAPAPAGVSPMVRAMRAEIERKKGTAQ